MTSKVRIRGVVEKTRTDIVGLASRVGIEDNEDGERVKRSGRILEIEEDEEEDEDDFNMGESSTVSGEDTEMDTDMDTTTTDGQSQRRHDGAYEREGGRGTLEMQIARVYERTIVALGETVDLSAKPLSAFSD